MSNDFNLDYPMLGLNHDASTKEIKRAYAKCLKTINQQTQAAEFEKLRAEYEFALNFSKNGEDADFFYQNQNQEQEEAASDLQLDADNELDKAEEWTEPETPFNNNLSNSTNASNFLLVETPYALMDAFNQEILNTRHNHRLLKVSEVEELLTIYLAKDEFLNLESMEAFEYFLIDSLHKHIYGINNLIVLLCVKNLFNWDQNWRVRNNYSSVFYVDDLLLNLGHNSDLVLQNFSLIAQTPNPKNSKLALAAYQELVNINQFLAEFCVPDDQLKLWQNCFKRRNILVKFNDTWMDKIILEFKNILDLPPHQQLLFLAILFASIRILQKLFKILIS